MYMIFSEYKRNDPLISICHKLSMTLTKKSTPNICFPITQKNNLKLIRHKPIKLKRKKVIN